ncbi:MAG: TetR/AcrR family transcriptional regulator [Planctomycetota bacterium]
MVTQNAQGESGGSGGRPGARRRGRPPGRSAQGEATRARIYDAAIELMQAEGFEGATLREIAARAGVSHALLYRYFPSKRAVVLALYERLSAELVRSVRLRRGPWRARALEALRASLRTLAPYRETLRGASGVLVSATDEGLFSRSTRTSRERVAGVFQDAVTGARDAPKGARGVALSRLLYLVHLAVVLTWLLDRSKDQRATEALVRLVGSGLALGAAALRLPGAWRLVERADVTLASALYEDGA